SERRGAQPGCSQSQAFAFRPPVMNNPPKSIERIMKTYVTNQLSSTSRGRLVLLAASVISVSFFIDVREGWTQENSARGVVGAAQYRVGEIKLNAVKALPKEMVAQALGLISGQVFDESQFRKNLESIKTGYGRL